MTCQVEWLHDYTSIKPCVVSLGDDHKLSAEGTGTIQARQQLIDGSAINVEFKKVLYVPVLAKNLISTAVITDAGFEVLICSHDCTIFDRQSQRVCLVASHVGRMLQVQLQLVPVREQAMTVIGPALSLD
jgi:hypothetical protein